MNFFWKILIGAPCILFHSIAYAQENQTEEVAETRFSQTFILIAIAIAFFYFLIWRPEQKRRKTVEHLKNVIRKGDRVTAMGIIGTIDTVKEESVIVSMVDGAKVEFLKSAISEIHPKEEEKKEKKTEKK